MVNKDLTYFYSYRLNMRNYRIYWLMKKSDNMKSIEPMLLVLNINVQSHCQVVAVMVLCHQVISYMVSKLIINL